MSRKNISLLIGMLLFILIMFFASGCGSNYHLRRAEHHLAKAGVKGAQWKSDTVFKTVEVIRPEIRIDSVVKVKNFIDTVIVTDKKVVTKVKVDTVNNTVYVQTQCPPDTVYVKVETAINQEIKAGKSGWHWLLYLGLPLLILGCIVGFVLRGRAGGIKIDLSGIVQKKDHDS